MDKVRPQKIFQKNVSPEKGSILLSSIVFSAIILSFSALMHRATISNTKATRAVETRLLETSEFHSRLINDKEMQTKKIASGLSRLLFSNQTHQASFIRSEKRGEHIV